MSRKKRRKRKTTPKLTRERQVVLDAQALRRWVAYLHGYLKFLTELKKLKGPKETVWSEKQRRYYLRRVRNLLDNTPSGGEALAEKARNILDTLE